MNEEDFFKETLDTVSEPTNTISPQENLEDPKEAPIAQPSVWDRLRDNYSSRDHLTAKIYRAAFVGGLVVDVITDAYLRCDMSLLQIDKPEVDWDSTSPPGIHITFGFGVGIN